MDREQQFKEILAKYGNHIMEHMSVEGITARAMGDYIYLIYADTLEEINEIIDAINARV